MNIAICDDDIKMLGLLEQIVFDCFNGNLSRFNCESFTSGSELLSFIRENEKFQIYILDIEMNAPNGLQTAAQIRAIDNNAIIIFETSHREMMQEAFDVYAFNYLLKPLDKEKTKKIILKAIELLQAKQSSFHFKIGKYLYSINWGDIEYFESNHRKIILYTKNGTFEFYGKLKDLNLAPIFCQIHASYVVNMEEIYSIAKNQIEMRSGKILFISKTYFKTFNDAYRTLLVKRYE